MSVNASDFSVAPEIAQLAASAVLPVLPGQGLAGQGLAGQGPPPLTAGRRAGELADLAAAPQRWWDLVCFDPSGPVTIPVPGARGASLLVLPPGADRDCDCAYATLIAGEATEDGRPLRSGRVLVHRAGVHRVRGAAHGYSVSLHGF